MAVLATLALVIAAAAEPEKLPPLTTVSGSPRLPGKFVWADLVTDDPAKAISFYSTLFGWTFRSAGNYAIGAKDERPLCGIFQRTRPKDHPEAKPRWFGYISVPDVGWAQRIITKNGGQVLAPPQRMPQRGEQAVFADPEGAIFGVIKSSLGDPEDFLAEPGDWIWMQLLSRDARQAGSFYRAVAGYEVIENDMSPRPEDFVFVSRGYARAVVLTIPKDKARVPPSWLPFVRVKSVNDCAEQAVRLGGRVLIPPDRERLDGKAAVIADPTGAAIGIMEWSGDSPNGVPRS